MGLFSKNKESKTIKVEGMTCQHCKMKVTKALNNVKGVKSVDVDLDKKEAAIVFSGAIVDNAVLAKAIEDAGFQFSGDVSTNE